MLPGELAELLSHPPLALISKQTAAERGRVVTRATMRITGGVRRRRRRRKLADNKTGETRGSSSAATWPLGGMMVVGQRYASD